MASLSTWLKDVLPLTPGAQRAVVRRMLELTCREFYASSLAWRKTLGPISYGAMVGVLKLDNFTVPRLWSPTLWAPTLWAPTLWNTGEANAPDVVRVLAVEYFGSPLTKLARLPGNSQLTANSPAGYYLPSHNTLSLYPKPSVGAEEALTVYAALTPDLTNMVLPDIAYAQHYDALLDGLLGRLYSQPAKPYSNPQLAAYHLKRFRNAIAVFHAEANSGYAGAASWAYPSFN